MPSRQAAVPDTAWRTETPSPEPSPPPGARPNVVWVLLDACRAKNLSCYGYDRSTSPALERLASGGALFRRHYCQGGWTAISVPSYMTGRYFPVDSLDFGHAMFKFFPRVVSPEEQSAPEIFRKNGYRTILVTAHPFLSPQSRLATTFDSATLVRPPEQNSEATADLGALLDTAKAQLEQGTGAPFFLYIHAMDTHYPYRIRPEHSQWVVPGYSGKAFRGGMVADGVTQFDATDQRQFAGMYDGSIQYADTQIGRLLAMLEDAKLRRNTLFIVTADHGELLGEDGHTWGHFGNLYDEGFHIPLIMAGPGIATGRVVNPVTENSDILPTLVDLLGLKTDARFDGQSLRGVLAGTQDGIHPYAFSKQGASDLPTDFLITGDTHRWVWNRPQAAGNLFTLPATPQNGLHQCGDAALAAPFSRFVDESIEPKFQAYLSLKPRFVRLGVAAPGPNGQVEFQPPLAAPAAGVEALSFARTLAWTPAKEDACWISPAAPEAVVRISVQAPPGRYGLFVIQDGRAAVDGHPASSLKVRVGDAEKFESLAWAAGTNSDGKFWTNMEPLALESSGLVKIELRPDNPEFWCAIWGIQLIEMDALPNGAASDEVKVQQEQVQAIGYL